MEPDELGRLTHELCRRFVRIPSISGHEAQLADVVLQTMHEVGFDGTRRTSLGNVVGQIGSGQRPRVLFDGHLDTVPVADPASWSVDPFGAHVGDNRIYGRGASDMKGSLAAMIAGVANTAQDIRLAGGTVYVCGTVLEEVFEGIGLGVILDEVQPDVVVIGEATSLNLNIGQRGRAEIAVTTVGRSAHSSNPQAGINAVYKMLHVIDAIRSLPLPSHDVLGHALLELTDVISAPYPGASVVPEQCRVTFDRRLLVDESESDALDPLRAILGRMAAEDAEFRGIVECVMGEERAYTDELVRARRFFPAWCFDASEPFVQGALNALHSVQIDAKLSHYSFCTNGSQSAGLRGIPTVGFGPSRENLAHVVDEHVDMDELGAAARGFAALARGLVSLG